MSKISLKSSSSGTATFTIESPATNTDRTLVLPDVAGTVALTSQIPAAYTDTDALDLFNASGSAPVFACRAFVNFNGTGTVAIRASGNVSSITDNGVGDYTVNFATAMPDANYSVSFGGAHRGAATTVGGVMQVRDNGGGPADNISNLAKYDASGFRCILKQVGSTNFDDTYLFTASIFR